MKALENKLTDFSWIFEMEGAEFQDSQPSLGLQSLGFLGQFLLCLAFFPPNVCKYWTTWSIFHLNSTQSQLWARVMCTRGQIEADSPSSLLSLVFKGKIRRV